MRVKFEQSGGFAGASRRCELDSETLPPEEARELESLVQASALPATGRFLSPAGRDLRVFEIEIEGDGGRVTVTFDDHTLPDRARPLVRFLRRSATVQGRGDR